MCDKNDETFDSEEYLSGVSDPEVRARTRREDGGLCLDAEGRAGFVLAVGDGDEAKLHRAIYGSSQADYDASIGVDEGLALSVRDVERDVEASSYVLPLRLSDSLVRPAIVSTNMDDAGDLLETDRQFYRDVLRLPLEFVHQHVARTLGQDLADQLAADLGVTRPMPPDNAKLRRAVLGNECLKLYEAVSFFNYSRGLTLNTFLTVSYGALGVRDHREAMRLHGVMNKKLANFLAVGLLPKVPHRRREPLGDRMEPAEHAYVYVAENARDHGFHVHQLMYVPPVQRRPGGVGRYVYEARMLVGVLNEWFAAQLGREVAPDAVHLRYHAPKRASDDLEWQWRVWKYISKLTSDDTEYKDAVRSWVSAREVFGLEPYIETCPVWCAQRAGGSHNIWTKAQKEIGFVSAFRDFRDSDLYSDWALCAFRKRDEEERRSKSDQEILKSLWDWDLNRPSPFGFPKGT